MAAKDAQKRECDARCGTEMRQEKADVNQRNSLVEDFQSHGISCDSAKWKKMEKLVGYCYDLNFAVNRKGENVLEHSRTGSQTPTSVCNRCWRTRGGRPIRLGNRPRRIPTETSRRIKASFTRVIDPTLQRINFTTLLGRRHPPGPHRRAGPHTGLSLAEEPESRSNSYLARKCRGEEGPRGLSEDTDGVIDQRRKKDSENLPPARSPKGSSLDFKPQARCKESLV
ncbi:hypothetical protein GEV33_002535 [Tenebrio molitor]|uniref:Uncharacterized protein n=1 Tax=Tenebrio molitor TaxID=7067 RepID=A0A8J6HUR7_TENMO|nr:hypothetical protein GEV33_002535 [Tenebrio molitor]